MIIDPRGFGDDVIAWADRMTLLVEREIENMSRLEDPENWQDWANQFYGQCPNPSAMIWTEETGGDGVSDMRIVAIAKSGRGSMAKR